MYSTLLHLHLLLLLSALTAASPARNKAAATTSNLGASTSQNGLSGPCKAMTVIFARGTTETGNVGTVTGPPFFASLATAIGGADNLAVQGVDYPADIPGFLAGGDAKGSATMAGLVKQAMTQCPDTKVVMSGYSQGGQLVHNAAKMLDAEAAAKVDSAVIFGDPDHGDAIGAIPASKTMVICHTGDNICAGGTLILTPHLTYSQNADQAAKFVADAASLGIDN